MQQRQLGRSGLRVSALGLGCMGMAAHDGVRDDPERGTRTVEESIRTIRRALELGVTLIDTADVYAEGANEELVGRALSGHRREVILATKCGLVRAGSNFAVSGTPKYLRTACEASLRRLGVDVIDLLYLHRVDPKTPIQESVGGMADLVRAGKVRYIGLSEAAASTLRDAYAVHPITALQSEYSLWTRDPEAGVLATCRELGIGFVPCTPLGCGFLTGTITSTETLPADDLRRQLPRFRDEHIGRNRPLVAALERIALEKRATAAQVALAWLLAKGDDIVPIPGTRRRSCVEENAAAVDVRLSETDVARLDERFSPENVSGERCAPSMMTWIGRG